ncbi:MAG: hypothetical protein RIS87_398 [Pseudomonadota bacterium]
MLHTKNNRWDIFCKIVDNYGDIGVCWRLSQQLAHEHNLTIRLLINDMASAKKIIPSLDISKQSQLINGVEVCAWPSLKNTDTTDVADVVLETFSCTLPEFYLQKMVQQDSIWINLEYLSAEKWVSDFHAKPSPHVTLAITKHYFFPGFKDDTGGLIRERKLITEHNIFTNSQEKQFQFWQKIGICSANDLTVDTVKISLFCYAEANISGLIESLVATNKCIKLFIPLNSSIATSLENLVDIQQHNLNEIHRGNLTIHLLPFLSQADYDCLLWACDLNFVRGEDSWIRAIWAEKPFIWQPYIQTDETHILKLKAFLDLYLNAVTSEVSALINESQLAWSSANTTTKMPIKHLIEQLPAVQNYAKRASMALTQQPDLATKLVIFSENLAKNKV